MMKLLRFRFLDFKAGRTFLRRRQVEALFVIGGDENDGDMT